MSYRTIQIYQKGKIAYLCQLGHKYYYSNLYKTQVTEFEKVYNYI